MTAVGWRWASHVQGVEHQPGVQVSDHRPVDDPAAPRVEHGSQVEEACPGWHVRDVSHPELIRGSDGNVAPDEIGGRLTGGIALGGRHELPAAHALQAGGTHEPRHALAPHGRACRAQLRVHPRGPLRAPRLAVDRVHARGEHDIRRRSRRQRPALRLVVSARRHLGIGVDQPGGDDQDPERALLRRLVAAPLSSQRPPVPPSRVSCLLFAFAMVLHPRPFQ